MVAVFSARKSPGYLDRIHQKIYSIKQLAFRADVLEGGVIELYYHR